MVQFYKVPISLIKATVGGHAKAASVGVALKSNGFHLLSNEPELYYKAQMPLYAISRAKVQYLGSCVPLFRFKHSLFEALICSIHENKIRPTYADLETLSKNVSTAHLISKKHHRMDSFQHTEFSNYFEQHEVLQDPIKHERFLMGKFLEFMSHPHLKPLLLLSVRGDTLNFVHHFNSLTETECPYYSRYKVFLYDINQRRFVVQVHATLLDSSQEATN